MSNSSWRCSLPPPVRQPCSRTQADTEASTQPPGASPRSSQLQLPCPSTSSGTGSAAEDPTDPRSVRASRIQPAVVRTSVREGTASLTAPETYDSTGVGGAGPKALASASCQAADLPSVGCLARRRCVTRLRLIFERHVNSGYQGRKAASAREHCRVRTTRPSLDPLIAPRLRSPAGGLRTSHTRKPPNSVSVFDAV